ncbi:MAG: hypothetical protein AB1403_00610 [Candidatus Riflebacteria bacterium]
MKENLKEALNFFAELVTEGGSIDTKEKLVMMRRIWNELFDREEQIKRLTKEVELAAASDFVLGLREKQVEIIDIYNKSLQEEVKQLLEIIKGRPHVFARLKDVLGEKPGEPLKW